MKISNKKVLILLLSIILTLGMMFILIPEVKATTEYDVWVNGQRFTDENTTIVCGEGTAFYNAETDTLTLNNATIETPYEYRTYYEALIYSERPNLTIKVNGENNLSTSSQYADGIDAGAGCNMNFTGYGTLNITNTYYGMYIGDWSTPGGNIVINGILLNVSETSAAGLWANKDITFSDCSAHITRTSSSYNGIVSNINGTITVDNSYVIVNNGMAGIHFGNGDNSNHALVVNSGELKVNVTGDEAYAIKFEPESGTENINGSITINGGKLDVTSSKGGTNLNQESIILGSNMIYKTGTSLINSGNIVIDKSDLLFPDVPNGKWFTEGIKYVKEKGIMSGYTSGPNAGYNHTWTNSNNAISFSRKARYNRFSKSIHRCTSRKILYRTSKMGIIKRNNNRKNSNHIRS